MLTWIVNLQLVAAILSSVWALWLSIRLQRESKSNLIIDWGPQPRRAHRWVFVAIVGWSSWYCWKTEGPNQLLFKLMAIMNALTIIRLILGTFRHLGIYKDGMLVLTQILGTTAGRFIPWSQIKTYRWEEQGRLLINPGWNPTICQISEERIADLDAVLKEKCLDADLAIQHVTP